MSQPKDWRSSLPMWEQDVAEELQFGSNGQNSPASPFFEGDTSTGRMSEDLRNPASIYQLPMFQNKHSFVNNAEKPSAGFDLREAYARGRVAGLTGQVPEEVKQWPQDRQGNFYLGMWEGKAIKAVANLMPATRLGSAIKLFKPVIKAFNAEFLSSKNLKVNPFAGKSFSEIDQLFTKLGFKKQGPNPAEGKGCYFHPVSGRKYYLDKGGDYREGTELPHVDVHRMANGNNLEKVGKKRYPIGDKLIEKKQLKREEDVNFRI